MQKYACMFIMTTILSIVVAEAFFQVVGLRYIYRPDQYHIRVGNGFILLKVILSH